MSAPSQPVPATSEPDSDSTPVQANDRATTIENDDERQFDDLTEEVERLSELPTAVNELDKLLSETPEELKRLLKEEFRAEFLGPVIVDPNKLD